ncbi:MAG: hypothetical protein ACTTI6_05230 [Treponema sp.]|uniref:hypothetical protein n=1 Tax=Treponema sp. TaxID=166 RepID=UPI003FA30FB7
MATVGKKRILDLPIKLVLTQEGSTFFIKQNKKLLRFTLAGNVEEYGISIDSFMPENIQRLILANYISKIEISQAELVSSRQEIMDLSKLIVFSLLYRQYDAFIFKQILASPVIKKWNRLNPTSIIDEKSHINQQYLADLLKKNEDIIYQTKKEILEPLYTFINKATGMRAEDKNMKLFLGEKFLNNLRPFTWFIITKFKNAPDFDLIVRTIRTSLNEYMDKTKIAEFTSLLLMELIQSAENMNMRNAAKVLFQHKENLQETLYDPKVRQLIIAELKRKDEKVFVSWKIGGGSNTSIGTQGKMQISLYNRAKSAEAVKENLNDMKKADVKRNSLIDFYKAQPEGSDVCSLGMYYISYLIEQCEKVNVHFESNASKSAADLTVVNLSFGF